jgi:pimeloyl-ACP methyl ester carboxylesterase/predicted amino acid-binding ACT domain protein
MPTGAEARSAGQVITTLPPAARTRWHVDHLVTESISVQGRHASYAVGGRGLPVLFLHGWGLDHRAYRRSLLRLTSRGCRVLAPALPGFGGTAPLPIWRRTIQGYAEWVAEFVDAVGVDGPMVVLGHSFGGGVATKLVHDNPELARYLVILNSVGDPQSFAGGLFDRFRDLRQLVPLDTVHWVLPTAEGNALRLIPRVFVENIVRQPLAVADAGRVAITADLAQEMKALAERGLPALVLWSDNDGVIPMTAFDTFCATFGADGAVVAGGHSWLLASPDVFGQVLDNVVHVQTANDHVHAATATTEQLRGMLRSTSVPPRVARQLLDGVSPLWAMSAPPAVLAGDLALCHPRLRPKEVRAVARRVRGTNDYRLTVVARDRPGLLADTASVLARAGLSVVGASATTWPHRTQALHSMTVRADARIDRLRWAQIGDDLRTIVDRPGDPVPFTPSGRASATMSGAGEDRAVVRVTAPDRVGLLAAVCRWFADHEISVESATVETVDGVAKDVFVVDRECDVEALAAALSPRRRCPLRPLAATVVPSLA